MGKESTQLNIRDRVRGYSGGKVQLPSEVLALPSTITITQVPIAVHWKTVSDFLLQSGLKKEDLGILSEQTNGNLSKMIHPLTAGRTVEQYIFFVTDFMSSSYIPSESQTIPAHLKKFISSYVEGRVAEAMKA